MRSVITVMCLVLVGATVNLADEGRRPINSRTVITEPGSYIVTRGFTSSIDAIVVEVDGVTIDLNGHTVASTHIGAPVINILEPPAGDRGGITIRNGTLSGGGHGVYVFADEQIPMRFENLIIEGAASTGIYLFGTRAFEIVDCTIRDISGSGVERILVAAGEYAVAKLERNIIRDVDGAGIDLAGTRGAVIADNVLQSTSTDGIRISGSGARVVRNTIHGAGGLSPEAGINLIQADGALVRDNVITGGAGAGINVVGLAHDRPVLLLGNTISGHGGHGIELTVDDALIEGNQIAGNDGFGLYVGYGGALVPYRNNLLRDNVAGSVGEVVAGVVDDQGGNICDGVCP